MHAENANVRPRSTRCSAELIYEDSSSVPLSLELSAGMLAALSLLCLSRCCVSVHAGTPGGPLRCGWMSINSTTTLQGRLLRGKPLAGLSVIMSSSSPSMYYADTTLPVFNTSMKSLLSFYSFYKVLGYSSRERYVWKKSCS